MQATGAVTCPSQCFLHPASAVTAGMAFVAMVAGIYGMNLHPYPQSHG